MKTRTILSIFTLLTLSFQPALQLRAEPLKTIEFPNIPDYPVPEGMGYEGFFNKDQPAKIVFGVSDPGHQLKESLINAANTIKYLKPRGIPYDIEIVLYGPAVHTANSFNEQYGWYAALYNELHKHGVVFSVCYNSLAGYKADPADLYDYMQVIPAGILQIAKKQQQGFAYIQNTK